MTTPQRDFAADQRLCDATTTGPWFSSDAHPNIIKGITGVMIGSACGYPDSGFFPSDAEAIENAQFIASARTGWPAALQRIRELEAEVEKLKGPSVYVYKPTDQQRAELLEAFKTHEPAVLGLNA